MKAIGIFACALTSVLADEHCLASDPTCRASEESALLQHAVNRHVQMKGSCTPEPATSCGNTEMKCFEDPSCIHPSDGEDTTGCNAGGAGPSCRYCDCEGCVPCPSNVIPAPVDVNASVGGGGGDQWKKIYVIRHAERYGEMSCLNECGWNRAYQYGNKFKEWNIYKIYAFNYIYYRKPTACERTTQTASWVAANKGIPINYINCKKPSPPIKPSNSAVPTEKEEDKMMADKLRYYVEKDPNMKKTQMIMVFWEHENIPPLINSLCGGDDPKCRNITWPGDPNNSTYDGYVEIDYVDSGNGYHHSSVQVKQWGINTCEQSKAWSCHQCSDSQLKPEQNAPGKSDKSGNRRRGCPFNDAKNAFGEDMAKKMDTATGGLGTCDSV